jgi:hypothetical protein
MSATGVNTFNAAAEDSVKGEIEFRGTVGNKIEEKTDKKGNPYLVFSAFSSEKDGEGYSLPGFVSCTSDRVNLNGCRANVVLMPQVNSSCQSIMTVSTSPVVWLNLSNGRSSHIRAVVLMLSSYGRQEEL